jgi:hypothetical protein
MLVLTLMLACSGRPPITPEQGAEPAEPAAEVVEAVEEAAEEATEEAAEATGEPAAEVVEAVEEAAAEKQADGGSCLSGEDCVSGICEGLGCGEDAPGVCQPRQRPCTRDLRPYCGCDGQTFRTSGSCPGKRYASRDVCPGDQGTGLQLTPP